MLTLLNKIFIGVIATILPAGTGVGIHLYQKYNNDPTPEKKEYADKINDSIDNEQFHRYAVFSLQKVNILEPSTDINECSFTLKGNTNGNFVFKCKAYELSENIQQQLQSSINSENNELWELIDKHKTAQITKFTQEHTKKNKFYKFEFGDPVSTYSTTEALTNKILNEKIMPNITSLSVGENYSNEAFIVNAQSGKFCIRNTDTKIENDSDSFTKITVCKT